MVKKKHFLSILFHKTITVSLYDVLLDVFNYLVKFMRKFLVLYVEVV